MSKKIPFTWVDAEKFIAGQEVVTENVSCYANKMLTVINEDAGQMFTNWAQSEVALTIIANKVADKKSEINKRDADRQSYWRGQIVKGLVEKLTEVGLRARIDSEVEMVMLQQDLEELNEKQRMLAAINTILDRALKVFTALLPK